MACPVRHRVPSVDREVEDRVLELARVNVGAPECARADGLKFNGLAQRSSQQVSHPCDELGRIQGFRPERLLTRESQQSRREAGGAGRGIHGGVQKRANITAARRQPSPAERNRRHDHREHVVEVMSDAAGELPDRLHFLHLAHLAFSSLAAGDLDRGLVAGCLEVTRHLVR